MLTSPPLLIEQYRIVTEVDELMALCDQLTTQSVNITTDSRRSLEALLPATGQAT